MTDLSAESQPVTDEDENADPRPAASHGPVARLVAVVTVIGFTVPVAAYFWFIGHFGVNVIVGDQWDDVTVIRHSYAGTLTFATLWTQHNENRILFPNLIMLVLAHTTHLDVVTEEYVSGVLLVAAIGCVIWAHKRRSPAIPWIAYCPVAIVMLSFVQYENSLWGFQLAWYLVLLAIAAAIVAIDRVDLTPWMLGAAIGLAVIASFSSLQGLLVWPAGLVLLAYRQRPRSFRTWWIVAAGITVILYFIGFNSHQGETNHLYAIEHPLNTIAFFFYAIGDVTGAPHHAGTAPWVIALGVVIVALAIGAIVDHGLRPTPEGGGPVGVALICVGLGFDVLITLGRAKFGLNGAGQSRYTTFDLLTLVGAYLLVIQPRLANAPAGLGGAHRRSRPPASPSFVRLLRVGITVAMALQIGFGISNGLTAAHLQQEYQRKAITVATHLSTTPNAEVSYSLYVFQPASFIRRQAHTAQRLHLSMYHHLTGPPHG